MDKYVVRIVRTRKEMNDFVRLPYKIYAGNSCYVPDLELDVRGTFNPSRNPGLEFSSIAAFVAYD